MTINKLNSDEIRHFYDGLADDYHLIMSDWEQSIDAQSHLLDKLFVLKIGDQRGKHQLLDCSCGIGTQSIGLAKLGYLVTGTDIKYKCFRWLI